MNLSNVTTEKQLSELELTKDSSFNIVIATEKHIDMVVTAAKVYREENHQYKDLPFDPLWVEEQVHNAILHPDHVILLGFYKGYLVGGLWGCKGYQIFSPVEFATDCFNYVLPPYRGEGFGHELVSEFESWAKYNNCSRVLLGANSGINNNQDALNCYLKSGYVEQGTNLIKSIG